MSGDRITASRQHGPPGPEDDRLGFRLNPCGDDPLTSTDGCPECAGTVSTSRR
jgi:hypothetical protein